MEPVTILRHCNPHQEDFNQLSNWAYAFFKEKQSVLFDRNMIRFHLGRNQTPYNFARSNGTNVEVGKFWAKLVISCAFVDNPNYNPSEQCKTAARAFLENRTESNFLLFVSKVFDSTSISIKFCLMPANWHSGT